MVVGPRFPDKIAAQVRAVVCVRPFVDEPMEAQLTALRARGIRLVADFDDLLFDGPAQLFPSVLQGRNPVDHVAARIGVYKRGLGSFDAFSVSTPQLVRHVQAVLPQAEVHLVANGLSRAWVRAGRLASHRYREGDARVIRYFAGSPTHDVDLALIAPVLGRFMARHRDVALELAGQFDRVPEALPLDRVRRLPMRPYPTLPLAIAPTWVSLAPLADSPFARCKSNIKYLEAAAFGVPTLASHAAPYLRDEERGLVGCNSPDEWEEALESMLDPAVRARASRVGEQTCEREGYADLRLEAFMKAALGDHAP